MQACCGKASDVQALVASLGRQGAVHIGQRLMLGTDPDRVRLVDGKPVASLQPFAIAFVVDCSR